MQVVLYTTSTCPYCQQEKQYLDEKMLVYETVVLDQSPTRMPEFLKESGGFSGVPVTVVTTDDGKKFVVKGFDQKALDSALAGKDSAQTPAPVNMQASPMDGSQTAERASTPSGMPGSPTLQQEAVNSAGSQTSGDMPPPPVKEVPSGQDGTQMQPSDPSLPIPPPQDANIASPPLQPA